MVSVDLPAHPSSATRARALARHRTEGLPAGVVETVALLVTELVTNAVLHARTALHLEIAVRRDVIVLRVCDGSPRPPVVRHYGTDDVTGRGVALVDALATRWGVETTATGKCVWCEIAIVDRPHAERYDGEVPS